MTGHPKVLSVFMNRGRKLHTTRSWDFMGLEHNGVIPSNSIWNKARFGEDVIIGNLDTGQFLFYFLYIPQNKNLNLSLLVKFFIF